MNPLVTAEVMAEIDRRTIEEIGIPGPVLMENAGRGTAAIIIETLEKQGLWTPGVPVTVVSGMGNNGGDGFVVARYLEEQDCQVDSYLVGKVNDAAGDLRLNIDIFVKGGGEVMEIRDDNDIKDLAKSVQNAHMVVDALFGTGLSKDIEGIHRSVIDTINTYAKTVCSIDIPSGVDASTGRVLGEAVVSDVTCTFGLMKVGQAVPPGCTYCGDLHILDIGFPEIAFDNLEVKNFLVTSQGVRDLIPERPLDFHKGKAGKVHVIGGSTGLTGAVVMACEGALVAGSGLIYAVIPESLNVIFEQKLTEQMTLPVSDPVAGCFSKIMAAPVLEMIESSDAVAIGPGLSFRKETEEFISYLLPKIGKPLVIDADGLNCLSNNLGMLAHVNAPVIVTPHEGEMSRLSGFSVKEVREDRLGFARNFSKANGVITVLKGYRTVIADPEGTIYVNDTGNPYMATGGMGDVLTGLILSFLGQGMVPIEAAICAVHLHGLSADIALEAYPRAPVLPRHVVSYYPNALAGIFDHGETADFPETGGE